MLRDVVNGKLATWEELLPLVEFAYNRDVVLSLDGSKRAEAMKKLHEKVRLHLEKKNQEVAQKANNGRKRIVLEPRAISHSSEDKVDVGVGPFQVLERLNDNLYKIDLPPEYQVQYTFNVCDLSPFSTFDDDDSSNLRTNSFQEGENDAIRIAPRPFTRSQARDLQRMQGFFMKLEVLELVLMAKKGFHALKIAWGSEGKTVDETVTLGKQEPFGI
ncbi:hypothetical protein KY290_021218 [Solanum tuberosum]|uniref:Tf2-1-like SH3-like domain-containing protein n=1 Tax=Solanum tuberosum TaxID=4113 RepID=A0ABQ7V0W5_SOLTU|nr:hypothetical protein KY290_021218 [Solanum tuberosum]